MNKFLIPVIASILILGVLGLAEDVFAPPKPPPEKVVIQPPKWDAGVFEINAVIKLPKDSELRDGYTVDTTIVLFKEDGKPIRATLGSTDTVPTGVGEGGVNNRVIHLPIRIFYEPPEELIGEKVLVVVTSKLLDLDGNSVDQTIKTSWQKFIKKFRSP